MIFLISPLGTSVTAKWADDERGFEKSVQRDKYPLIHGETGVDFGGGADAYDMTLIFDGPSCDLAANQFYEAAKELGTWMVIHPMHGMVELQLLSLRERVTPVSSDGRFEIETHWMEPLDPLTMMTLRQLTGLIDAQLAAFSASSVAAFSASAVLAGFGSFSAIVSVAAIASVIAGKVADKVLYGANMAACAVIATSQTGDSQAALAASCDAAVANTADFDPSAIATAMHGMMQGPVLASSDPSSAIRLMSTAVGQMAEMVPLTTNAEDLNRCHTVEVGLEAVLGASCLATTIGNLQTRTQAIAAARALAAVFYDITETMDAVNTAFASQLRPERRYYAQTDTYEAALLLVSSCIEYLIRESFDLRIEKRITLDRDKTPIQICVEEYGLKAEDNLDPFIDWNALEGDDVMILPQSREVVVYVEPRK
jgi:hypothetical protein